MSDATLIAVAVLGLGVPLNAYVTYRLWHLARARPHLRVVRERAIVATAVLVIVVLFGFVFLSNDQVPPYLPLDVTRVVTRLAILLLAVVPASYWLWVYRRWP